MAARKTAFAVLRAFSANVCLPDVIAEDDEDIGFLGLCKRAHGAQTDKREYQPSNSKRVQNRHFILYKVVRLVVNEVCGRTNSMQLQRELELL
jgi:hypothetical protein